MYLSVATLSPQKPRSAGAPAQPALLLRPSQGGRLLPSFQPSLSHRLEILGVVIPEVMGAPAREETRCVKDLGQSHPAMRKMTRKGSVAMVKM